MGYFKRYPSIEKEYDMMVPQLAQVSTLEEALAYNPEMDSLLHHISDGTNIMEGVVIKPLLQEALRNV